MTKRLLLDHAVAGVHYHDFAEGRRALREGEAITLVREPQNPHDRFAVRLIFYMFSALCRQLLFSVTGIFVA